MLNRKKAAISLSDAPQVVIIVGFIFLIMATMAYVSSEYQSAFSTTENTVSNENNDYYLNGTTFTVLNTGGCDYEDFTITSMVNATDGTTIGSGNYTVVRATAGTWTNSSNDWNGSYEVNISYTYDTKGTACNVTTSLNEELDSNTSIAGIVLTISLVGIVLSILISVFVGMSRRKM